MIWRVICSVCSILFFFTCVSCRRKDRVEIYNPYDSTMKIKIDDGTGFEISANSTTPIDISVGKHTISSSLFDKKILDTVVVISSEFKKTGGYLNVTNQPVYLWSQVYGEQWIQDLHNHLQGRSDTIVDGLFEQRYKSLKFNYVKIDSVDIYGPIHEFPKNQLTINKNWYFFIGQNFEDKIKTDKTYFSGLGKTVNKLFSKDEMLNYWASINK